MHLADLPDLLNKGNRDTVRSGACCRDEWKRTRALIMEDHGRDSGPDLTT
jgi:hypothetical protein